jgi:hypothetical protein
MHQENVAQIEDENMQKIDLYHQNENVLKQGMSEI